VTRVLAAYPAVVASLLVLTPLLAPRSGPLALATILSAHLTLAALVLLPIAIARRAPALRLSLLVLALVAVARFGDEWFSLPPNVDPSADMFRTATWNLELGARSGEDAVDGIRRLDVDVLALQELGPEHVRAINASSELMQRFPVRELHPAPGVFGIGLLSRHPVIRTDYYPEPSTIEAVLDVGGQPVTVITAHPLPGFISTVGPVPVSFDASRRDIALRRVRNVVEDTIGRGETVVLLGDFNVAPTEPAYAELVDGLRDAHVEVGLGPGWTWRPSRLESAGIGLLRIDLAISGSGARPVSVRELCDLPGDHCQLQAAYQLVSPSVEPIFLLLPGGADSRPLPVSVVDESGVLAGARPALRHGAPGGAQGVPGQPELVRVTWLGGLCDVHAAIKVEGSVDHLRLAIESHQTGNACPAVGVFRTIELRFLEAIDPTVIDVVQAPIS
jgi:endonuclease/exonuclease/phosphatase (EEP) superfamily protein YafD